MVKLLISVRSMIGKSSFKVVALSFLLAAAFLFSSTSCFAVYSADSRFLDTQQVAVSTALDLGSAFVLRAALGALTIDTLSDVLSISPTDIAQAIAFGGGSTLPPAYTYNLSLLDFLSRETIRIRPDSVTIGGVEMSDVWLPHDCADKFRTNAFDFITRYNIASESVGTFVEGAGTVCGVPIFFDGSLYKSQNYVIPASGGILGDITVTTTGSDYLIYNYTYDGVTRSTGYAMLPPVTAYFSGTDVYLTQYQRGYRNASHPDYVTQVGQFRPVLDSFDFDWVSGTIPVDPLPITSGLRLRLPSSYVSGLPQILDPESASYSDDLDSLIDSLTSAASSDDIDSSAFENWDTPIPGSGTIADEPYSSLSGALNGLQSIINSILTSVSGIADSIVGADSTFFGNIVSALAAPFEPVFAIFRSGVGIWSYVVSWIGTISAPFSWSLSVLGSAGNYFLSPIYAASAAAVVLAVYKKFGR